MNQIKQPGHTVIVNQTWIRNMRRDCQGMSEAMIGELLTGVKVVGGPKALRLGTLEKDIVEMGV